MQVRKVDTTKRRDVRAFIRFPFELYRDCPQWVPPLMPDMRAALNKRRYPFYRHSEADFFLAESEGQVVGRITALDNRRYNDFHDSKVAFFYHLEMVEDEQVAQALFDAAFQWARRRDLNTVVGPKGLLRGDAHGVLIRGFEHRPSVGVPYNYAYYDRLIQGSGLSKHLDYDSAYVSRAKGLPPRVAAIAARIQKQRGIEVKALSSKAELRAAAPLIQRVYEQAFVQVPDYYPITQGDVEAMIDRLSAIVDPSLIKMVTKDGEPIGFMLAYPDVAAAIQRIKGRLWPLGWLQVLVEARRTEWVTFNGVGVIPAYQGAGVNAILYAELAKTVLSDRFSFKHGDAVQAAETNRGSVGDGNAFGVEWYKTHRVYRAEL
jgi:GNAT superfamily N-acetyltransferase